MKKPKHSQCPKAILTIGDELRSARIDRGLTQHQVAEIIDVNRNLVYEMELNHHTNTIFALHKVYLFLGYIPITLKIGSDLREKLFEYRIIHGYPYKKVADKIGIDKSTLSNFEKGRGNKKDTIQKIKAYLGIIF